MGFTIDSPSRYEYIDSREGQSAAKKVEVETTAISRTLRNAIEQQSPIREPSGYRIMHVFQVADDVGEPENIQYVESMDVETWEHIGPAVETLMTRTRSDGWTVALTVVSLDVPRPA